MRRLPRVEYSKFVPSVHIHLSFLTLKLRQKSRTLLLEALQKPYKTELDLSKLVLTIVVGND